MIKIHRDNRVIFWLLIGALVMNILWSLRLELQAQDITIPETGPNKIIYELNTEGKKPFKLVMSGKTGTFQLTYDKIVFVLGNISSISKDWNDGILMGTEGFKQLIYMGKEEGMALRDIKNIYFIVGAPGDDSKAIYLKMKTDTGSTEIRNDKSTLSVGPKNISIEAEGDIDIRSKNGVLKLNGKKIHMNK
ncbi:MAG: hypothetical protein AMJ94_03495 [Deltaproteobacteria bacterium SM23_61]|nr:MAG: hypothetical protein AMJ94_03495 [Deltaproteobacteria bacterium SM23_61]